MQLKIEIPDEVAMALASGGQDPERAVLEAILLEAYRERRIGGYQLRTMLGFGTRFELDEFLKAHQVDKYTATDFDDDLAAIRRTRASNPSNPGA